MTDIYKLTDGTSSVDISPIRGENVPESRVRQVMQAKTGKQDAYEWGGAYAAEIPFNNINSTKAAQLVTWWENMTVLTLTFPSDPGDSYQVVINEPDRPPQMWGGDWDTLFAGIITVNAVSSQSFSSSHVSVSRSQSCSSFNSSSSRDYVSSLSCSQYLLSVSRSSSFYYVYGSSSCSTWGSTSCSVSFSRSCSISVSDSTCSDIPASTSCSTSSYLFESCSTSSSPVLYVVAISVVSQSCSLNPSSLSYSVSGAGKSCSVSAGGIS